jgi:hypothetical protein
MEYHQLLPITVQRTATLYGNKNLMQVDVQVYKVQLPSLKQLLPFGSKCCKQL